MIALRVHRHLWDQAAAPQMVVLELALHGQQPGRSARADQSVVQRVVRFFSDAQIILGIVCVVRRADASVVFA